MTTAITIYPESSPSPYQVSKPHAPEMVNNDFFAGLSDVLNIINPLQHIPGVSTLYQQLTGDKPSAGAQIAGDVLFGGPVGLIASIANLVFEQETGKNIGASIFAAATGKYQKAATLAS